MRSPRLRLPTAFDGYLPDLEEEVKDRVVQDFFNDLVGVPEERGQEGP